MTGDVPGLATALITPAVLWILYLYKFKDCCRPEPLPAIGEAYLAGIAGAAIGVQGYVLFEWWGLPADPIALLDRDPRAFWWYAVGVAGPLEELAKFLPFAVLLLFRRPHINDPTDGLVYASVIALGFATVENIYYLPQLAGFERAARAITSPAVHMLFASIWGHVAGSAYVDGRPWIGRGLAAYAVAAVAHGVFDVLTLQPAWRLAAAAIALLIWGWRERIAHLHQMGHRQPKRPRPPVESAGS